MERQRHEKLKMVVIINILCDDHNFSCLSVFHFYLPWVSLGEISLAFLFCFQKEKKKTECVRKSKIYNFAERRPEDMKKPSKKRRLRGKARA